MKNQLISVLTGLLLISSCDTNFTVAPINTDPETTTIAGRDSTENLMVPLIAPTAGLLLGKLQIMTVSTYIKVSQTVHYSNGKVRTFEEITKLPPENTWIWKFSEPGDYFIFFYQNGTKPADTTLTVPANASFGNPYRIVQLPGNYASPLRVVIQWNNQTKNDLVEFTIQ